MWKHFTARTVFSSAELNSCCFALNLELSMIHDIADEVNASMCTSRYNMCFDVMLRVCTHLICLEAFGGKGEDPSAQCGNW